jgi:hypothetical protein
VRKSNGKGNRGSERSESKSSKSQIDSNTESKSRLQQGSQIHAHSIGKDLRVHRAPQHVFKQNESRDLDTLDITNV